MSDDSKERLRLERDVARSEVQRLRRLLTLVHRAMDFTDRLYARVEAALRRRD